MQLVSSRYDAIILVCVRGRNDTTTVIHDADIIKGYLCENICKV